jgi:CBS domain containing-hemolysin-like protein
MTGLFLFLASSEALATQWESGGVILLQLLGIMFLVLLNGFFVASEFAIVKVRGSQLEAVEEEGEKRAPFARHVTAHLDAYLSATQLGITLSSLALGWVGEPFWRT